MSEKKIFLNSGNLKIEGLLEDLPGDKGVVVCHPHPLYGGSMHNNVVIAVCQAYNEKGYSTLRFNFRGIGESDGSYDNGIGEQNDVKTSLKYFSNLGKKKIDLAGYSFGAWINSLGLDSFEKATRMIMISPPVSAIDFTFLKYNPKIELVITGSRDDIAEYKTINEMLPVWNPKADFKIIEGADHFYQGKTDELKDILLKFLENK